LSKIASGLSWVAAILGSIAILVVLAVGAWRLGWFVKEKNTEKQVQVDNHQKGTQTAWYDEAVDAIRQLEIVDPANAGAKAALSHKACDMIARLDESYRDDYLVDFEKGHCA
jgi:FtsZ-interacting cell division protein ZipA